MINSTIKYLIDDSDDNSISATRKANLKPLVEYIQLKKSNNISVNLNFICTHNSRRSQFAQLWAQVFANYYGINVQSFSGGTEVTALNERVIDCLLLQGFLIECNNQASNPHYLISWGEEGNNLNMFSKVVEDPTNPNSEFAAIMTCSHADENCPIVIGCEERIPIRYDDPKAFDNTPQEKEKYLERSVQIAAEMKYVFSQVSTF